MSTKTPYLGFIEGFYGKSYSLDERNFLLSFLANNQYSFYIYAPKEDAQLRDQWQAPISESYATKLSEMGQACHALQLDFGVALSPLNLTSNFASQKALLLERVKQLCEHSQCDIFCLLFDDMFKDSEHIGSVQNEIIAFIDSELPSTVKRFIVCPSYYTDDPVLDRIFGQRPAHYFTEFTKDLSSRVEIFWTGPKVLSEEYSAEHLEQVEQLLGRKPFIWDNYPVNDGFKICQYLFLNKFTGRDNMAPYITGHAVNPMVQCVLSTLPAITLPLIYQGKDKSEVNAAYLHYAKELLGKAAHELLRKDYMDLLTKVGLKNMSAEDKAKLMEFASLDDSPALAELRDFLNGSMRFDQSIVNGTHTISQQVDQS